MKNVCYILFLCCNLTVFSQVATFKLSNGLTVIINEDHRAPTVFGNVVVRAGSVDEPSDATGLAHYLNM